ncbi:MAG: histidine triad nucleotide-binding protein [Gemmatimonadota bacterium]
MASSASCPFCRIARGELPAKIVYETDEVVAFEDLSPQAPAHLLVIPRRHVASLDALDDAGLAGDLLLAAAETARLQGIDGAGYRVVTNIGEEGGQSVAHLHLHILGGRRMAWPPG